MANMLSLPAYTEEMAQQGQTSMTPGSLFNPNQLSMPVDTQDDYNISEFMRANGIDDIVQGRAAYYNQQQPNAYGGMTPGDALGGGLTMKQPSPYGDMTPGQALGGAFTMQPPTPVQQLSSPSLTDLAQTQPFQPTQPLPMATKPPETQQLVQQIQAPTTNMPAPSVPVLNQPPATQQLIQQIKAPTTPRAPTPPPINTRQFAQQFRQAATRPAPVAKPQPMVRAAPRPAAQSVSRVNPPLLPSRPMGRR